MAFIETISEADAAGTLKELYQAGQANSGYIANYLKLFSHRPDVYCAWENLIASIRKNMTLRRYELVTLAAARALQSTYCMMAHSQTMLTKGEADADQLIAIATDYHQAGLSAEEVAVMDFAEKIVHNSSCITQADVDHLKSFGLTDADIFDITVTSTARCFFSKTLDALNAEPDAKYMKYEAPLREALSVGRPFGIAEKSY